MKLFFYILIIIIYIFPTHAEKIGETTGLTLPRFVSLKSNDSNLRIGSSLNYPIKLKYIIANMPIEVVDEYKDWRNVRDMMGNEGWMHQSILKRDRYAIINTPYIESVQIAKKPQGEIIGEIGKNNIVKLNQCLINWCKIDFDGNRGWVNKSNLWGVYNNEKFNVSLYQKFLNLVDNFLN